MKKLLAGLAVCLATLSAKADENYMVFATDTLYVKLYSSQRWCLPKLHSGVVVMLKEDGREVRFCWSVHEKTNKVVILDEDGDVGILPIENFSEPPKL